jgi:hypothetical protein
MLFARETLMDMHDSPTSRHEYPRYNRRLLCMSLGLAPGCRRRKEERTVTLDFGRDESVV